METLSMAMFKKSTLRRQPRAVETNNTKTVSDWLEQWSKILSAVAIPIVLLIIGNVLNQPLQDRTINRDYVQIATAILKEPIKSSPEQDSPEVTLREWAVSVLKHSSPVPLPDGLTQAFVNGKVSLDSQFGPILIGGPNGGALIAPGEYVKMNLFEDEFLNSDYVLLRIFRSASGHISIRETHRADGHLLATLPPLEESDAAFRTSKANKIPQLSPLGSKQEWVGVRVPKTAFGHIFIFNNDSRRTIRIAWTVYGVSDRER